MQCDQEVALSGFLSQVQLNHVEGFSGGAEGATLVAVVGGGCVTDSEIIVDTIAAGQWKTPLVCPMWKQICNRSKMSSLVVCFLLAHRFPTAHSYTLWQLLPLVVACFTFRCIHH